MIWKVRDREIPCERTLLMGILNLTPDSFSDGGKFLPPPKAMAHAIQMVSDGADILDLGGESTRPGAEPVSAEEELNRILPVLKPLCRQIQIPVSIDTTKPEVAKICLEEGAHIINDVSGLKDSGVEMAEVIRHFGAGLILMHRRGNPQTMQTLSHYQEVTADVMSELQSSIQLALEAGISREQLAIDPGLGFAKTVEQNLEIIKSLEQFHLFGCPVLLGPSRKSFVGRLTGRQINEREYGTAAVAAVTVLKGVHILRIHDVSAMRDVVRMTEALLGGQYVRPF